MARTKVPKKAASKPTKEDENTKEHRAVQKERLQKLVENRINKAKILLQALRTQSSDDCARCLMEERMKVPKKCSKLSVGEMRTIASLKSYETISSMSCMVKEDALKIANSTKSNRKVVKSSSSTDDGYLTTESSSSRHSRSTTRGKCERVTRSLSRTNKQNSLKPASTVKKSEMKTPVNKRTPPNSYGVVTPKCKPNTPLVLLRRPKMGEVAISMQGSPLMTASIATEDQANINIPLGDGTMLSLLPQKGLRMSQIPQFDSGTLAQLSSLSENLKKVVELNEKKYGHYYD